MRRRSFLGSHLGVYVVLLGVFLALCPVVRAGELTVRGHDFHGTDWYYSSVNWAEVALTDNTGAPVMGVPLEDFTVTESFVTYPAGELVEGPLPIDIAAQIADAYDDGGFWEELVSDVKLDVVFITDSTGTMSDSIDAIRAEIHAFVDRLAATPIDFRVACVNTWETPQFQYEQFHGRAEVAELHQGIDDVIHSAGDWWSPTCTFDALLWTPWLGFRDDAQKICVIITDIPPQTVYGTFWYPISHSLATRSAAEIFLESYPDMQLYYCLDPEEDVDFGSYMDPDINPMASDAVGGLEALENAGLAIGLRDAPGADPWPFQQERIPLPTATVSDSSYFFTWELGLEGSWDLRLYPENYRLLIEISTSDPDKASSPLVVAYQNVAAHELYDIELHVTDERGAPHDEASTYLYYMVGDRTHLSKWQLGSNEDGITYITNVLPGRYRMQTQDSGHSSFGYTTLRAIDRRYVDLPVAGLRLDAVIGTADSELTLAMLRGLLKDLKEWGISGAPFREAAEATELWLDEQEALGLDWRTTVSLRRLLIALSGYANMGAYAKVETDQAIEDFHDIVEDVRSVIAQIENLHTDETSAWEQALSFILEVVYDIFTRGEFTIKREAVERGLNELIKYAEKELLQEIRNLVIEEIPGGPYKDVLVAMFKTCVDENFEDWTPVIEAAKSLAIHVALEEATEHISGGFTDAIFSGIDLPTQVEQDIANLLRDVIRAFIGEAVEEYDESFDNFDDVLAQFAEDLVLDLGAGYVSTNRNEVETIVADLFDQIEANVPDEMPGIIRDFLLGMARDLVLEVVRTVDPVTYKCNLDSDRIVEILIRHGLYQVVLKRYYVDEARIGMEQALYRAQHWTPIGEDRGDWRGAMSGDFYDYNIVMRNLQQVPWNAMQTQDAVNEWAQALDTLVFILTPLQAALDFVANFYPALQDTADHVAEFIIVLDSIQVLSTAIEFGLRIESLDTFGEKVSPLYNHALPGFEELNPAVTIRTADATAIEGDPADPALFTITRTGSAFMPVVINYSVSGMAQNAIDCYTLPGAAVMLPGETSIDVKAVPIRDFRGEPDEIIQLTLEPGAYTVGFPFTAAAVIEDEGLPGISITATDALAREPSSKAGSGTALFTVSRDGDTSLPVIVNYRIWGTATNGADYVEIADTVAIPAGMDSAGILITPLSDSVDEANESVTLELQDGVYALGMATEATIVIGEDEAQVVSVAATDGQAIEGVPADTIVFTISREGDTTHSLTVYFELGGDADNSYDYPHVDESVEIPIGADSVDVIITPTDDATPEGAETVVLDLLPVTDVPEAQLPLEVWEDYSVGSPTSAAAVITDPTTTLVAIEATDPEAIEGAAPEAGEFTVYRTGDTSGALSVSLDVDGSATGGDDYTVLPASADFGPGETSVVIAVDPLDDAEAEGPESVRVTVLSGVGYDVGAAGTALVTILDDESPFVSFYVDRTIGDDVLNVGTQALPWATIARAMDYAATVATPKGPVTIYLAEGVYEEQVVFAPHVSLVGAGPELTTIQYYDAGQIPGDGDTVVIGAEGAVLRDCTITLPDVYETVTVLVRIDNVAMTLTNVTLDGEENPFCTAIEVAGSASSASVVDSCHIVDVYMGVWSENSSILITRTLFEDITGYGVFVVPVIVKDALVPRLGGMNEGVPVGMNQFRDVDGYFIKNLSEVEVEADFNDWGVYTDAEIGDKLSGPVQMDAFLGESIASGMLFIQLIDEAGQPIPVDSNPSVSLDEGAVTADYDPDGGMFFVEGIEGVHTLAASADGYFPLETSVDLPAGESAVEVITLEAVPPHTADQDGDNGISLSELLRVIQFFNSGAFHCEAGTEDGYAPGTGADISCGQHMSDYAPHDWAVSLSELLRLIQFYNSGGYHGCPGEDTEDGYCPGLD